MKDQAKDDALEDMQDDEDEDEGTRYAISIDMADRLKGEVTYHSPHGDQAARYVEIREAAREFLGLVLSLTPPSREQSNAHSRIREAVMWANAAIAINESEGVL